MNEGKEEREKWYEFKSIGAMTTIFLTFESFLGALLKTLLSFQKG